MKKTKLYTAADLHQINFHDDFQGYRNTTLFPFFDSDGDIYHWLVVQPSRGRAWFIDEPPHLRRLFDSYIISGALPSANKPERDQVTRFSNLLHVDPWWLLKDPGLSYRPWTMHLKKTNIGNLAFLDHIKFDLRNKKVLGLELLQVDGSKMPNTTERALLKKWKSKKRLA